MKNELKSRKCRGFRLKSGLLVANLLLTFFTFSQESNTWYFGFEAGLNFNSSASPSIPEVLVDGKMVADEGCSSISDKDGKILFYTNGVTVYNRNHEVMLNGEGLAGHQSATQSSVIVPWPGNDSLFFIFTSDAFENNFVKAYSYSIINIKKDNGLGEVVIKNTPLIGEGTEKMTAARHANGSDVWLITNRRYTNTFDAWLIDCNGISTTPVSSHVGEVLSAHIFQSIGTIKVSPDGRQLCQANFPELDSDAGNTNFFQLFSFNNATGQITNPKRIQITGKSYFACEFSPGGEFIYLSSPSDSSIYQFEAGLATEADIAASITRLYLGYQVHGMQIAPDRKIYCTGSGQYLHVINKPDLKGLNCDLGVRQIHLKNKGSRLQLPSMINDLAVDMQNYFDFQILDSCSGRVQFNGHTSLPGAVNWFWDFGNGNTSNLQNPLHQFTPANTAYTVTLSITPGNGCSRAFKITKNIIPSGINSKTAFSFDVKCDSGFVRFRNESSGANLSGANFTWDFGDGNSSTELHPTHHYDVVGVYPVKLKYILEPGCLSDSTTILVDVGSFPVEASPNTTVLLSEPVRLSVDELNASSYEWSPGLWLNDSTIREPVSIPLDDIVYVVRVTNQHGCVGTDSVSIKVIPVDDVFVPTAFTPNGDGLNDILFPVYGPNKSIKEFAVYNRWGQRIFRTSQRGHGWNGKIGDSLQPTGVYVYVLTLLDEGGAPSVYKGKFTLIR